MCIECHEKLSDELVVEQLNSVSADKFHKFNLTSLSHLYIASSGYNGLEARKIALRILSDFISYRESLGWFAPGSEEFNTRLMKKNLRWLQLYNPDGQIKPQIIGDMAANIYSPGDFDDMIPRAALGVALGAFVTGLVLYLFN